MSEKRFKVDKLEKGNAILSVKITDSVSDDDYFIMTKEAYEDDIDEVVDLLNEQQATINTLKEENEQLRKELDSFKPVMFQDVRKGTVILYSKG